MAGFEGEVAPARFEAHPLIADDGAAALDGDAVVMVARAAVFRRIARVAEAAALDHQIGVVAGNGPDRGEVPERPGDVADDAPLLLDVEQLLARPTRVAGVARPDADAVLVVLDHEQVIGVGGQFGDELDARPEFLDQSLAEGVVGGEGQGGVVVLDDEAGHPAVVETFVHMEDGLAPLDVGADGDAVGLLDPELAARVDHRHLMLVGVGVGQLDLDPVVALAVGNGAEHAVVDGVALVQDGQQAGIEGDDIGPVGLHSLAGLAKLVERAAAVAGGVETGSLQPFALPLLRPGLHGGDIQILGGAHLRLQACLLGHAPGRRFREGDAGGSDGGNHAAAAQSARGGLIGHGCLV